MNGFPLRDRSRSHERCRYERAAPLGLEALVRWRPRAALSCRETASKQNRKPGRKSETVRISTHATQSFKKKTTRTLVQPRAALSGGTPRST